MAQLLLLAAVGIVAWFGYKKFVQEAERVTAAVKRAKKEEQTGASGTLVKDPETGEYRLERRDDEQ
jgi:membrane protein implicated in regulation of membrane protease activity